MEAAASSIFTMFSSENITMAKSSIKRKLDKVVKKYEAVLKSMKKEKSSTYFEKFMQSMHVSFVQGMEVTVNESTRAVNEFIEVAEMDVAEMDESEIDLDEEMDTLIWAEESFIDEVRFCENLVEEIIELNEHSLTEDSDSDVSLSNEREMEADSDYLPEEDSNEEEELTQEQQRELPTGSSSETFVSRAIKSPELTKACVATKTSPSDLMLLTSAMNHANKVKNTGNSESTIYNEQKSHRTSIADEKRRETREFFREKSVFIHFDEKSMKNVTQEADERNNIQRCALVASSHDGSRLLAIKKIQRGTGESIAKAMKEVTEEYELFQWLAGFVFDTTLANTGIENGSTAIFERHFQQFLLYLGCRHHVFEVYLKTCFDVIFGSTGESLSKAHIFTLFLFRL